MRNALLFLLLLLVTVLSRAQDRAMIMGDAADEQDVPIASVQLTLRNGSLGIQRTTSTNADGLYFFAEVPPADGYTITALIAGVNFSPAVVKFNLQVGQTRQLLPPFIGHRWSSSSASRRKRRTNASTLWTGDRNVSRGVAATGLNDGNGKSQPAAAAAALAPARWRLIAMHEGAESQTASAQSQDSNSAPQGSSQQKPSGSPPTPAGTSNRVVELSPVPLDTVSNAVSTVITSDQLRDLPLYNRNFLTLGLLTSNTHDVPAGSELKDTTFSVSGQRPTSNLFLLDGMDNVASSSNQAIPFQVNDAIQEFRVTTAGADTQFGRNMGGTVNIVTQRGTARFHGSIFGFFGADALNANLPVSVYNGSGFDQAAAFAGVLNAKPAQNTNPNGSPIYEPTSYNQYVNTVNLLNQQYGTKYCTSPSGTYGSASCNPLFDPAAILAQHNSYTQPWSSQQFGGQAGGSFLKRWFWFGDYEGTRIDNPNPIFERVPSSYDRSHLDQFSPGSPGYQDAKFAQSVLSLYPQANVIAVPDVLEFFRGQAPNYTNVNNYLARLDFNQTANTDWTFRWNWQLLSQLHDDTLPASSVYPGNGAQRTAQNQNAVVTFTHRLSGGSASNVLRTGFSQFRVNETPQDVNFDASQLGLPAGPMQTYLLSGLDPQYAGAQPGIPGAFGGWYNSIWAPAGKGVPVIAPSLDGLFAFARVGAPLSAPASRNDAEWEEVDNFSFFRGRHSIRLGGDFRCLYNKFNDAAPTRGFVISSDIGEFTTDSATCNGPQCAGQSFSNPGFDYALKQPASYQSAFHSYVVAGYIQDTWRVKPNLVLNLGLRYEYFSPSKEVNNQLWNYDPVADGLVRQNNTTVVDPYGIDCASAEGHNTLQSVYLANAPQRPWNCQPSGNGQFVRTSKTNFEPRLGFAWSTPRGNTVVRAGFGIFYDQIPVSDIAQLMFNRPTPYSSYNPQAIYGQNYASSFCDSTQCSMGNTTLGGVPQGLQVYQSASVPFAINALDPQHLGTPNTRQITASVERQFTNWMAAEAGYIGNFMQNLPVKSNTGFNNEWFCTASAVGHTSQPCDVFSYLPVFTLANVGYGNYNALYFKLTSQSWHGLQTRVSYTFSKALDNGSSAGPELIPAPMMTQLNALQYYGIANPTQYGLGYSTASPPPSQFGLGSISPNLAPLTSLLTQGLSTTGVGSVHVTPYTIPQDPYNFLKNDYGRSDYDQTNRFIVEYTWAIPYPHSSALLNGWNLSGIFMAQSGQPFTIFSGPIGGELTQRVSLNGTLTTTGNPNQYIGNTSNIVLPALACQQIGTSYSPYVVQQQVGIHSGQVGTPCLGDSERNQFTGPAYVDYDMAVQKAFKFRERYALLFRAESYNLFNRANYYNPISTYSLDGVTQYSQFGEIKSAHSPRQLQFAVRMSW
jgi:hypothetical protein